MRGKLADFRLKVKPVQNDREKCDDDTNTLENAVAYRRCVQMTAGTEAAAKLTGKARDRFRKFAALLNSDKPGERESAFRQAHAVLDRLQNTSGGPKLQFEDALREIYGTPAKTIAPPSVDPSDLELELDEMRVLNDTLRAQLTIADQQIGGLRAALKSGDIETALSPWRAEVNRLAVQLRGFAADRAADRKMYLRRAAVAESRVIRWRRVAWIIPLCVLVFGCWLYTNMASDLEALQKQRVAWQEHRTELVNKENGILHDRLAQHPATKKTGNGKETAR